ncbi:YdeI/OmpD-associated family protein [Geodermatophilus sp. SYSU D00742]
MRFTTTIELGGKTATGFEVPPGVVEALGSGRRPAVTVTLAGHSYRSTVATMGGRFLVPLAAENRAAAGVAAGDTVEVDLELDTAPRVVEVPADLARALDAEPEARRRFDALSYSHQRRHVLAVEGAKAAATRERRVAAAVATLLEG